MFFQGRGNVYLREIDSDGNLGPAHLKLCTDTFAFSANVDSGTHDNKCGAVDVEDDRYIKKQSAQVTMNLAHVEDKNFALGIFGTVNGASSPGTVVDELLPAGVLADDYYFAGGKSRHRALTGVTITDSVAAPVALTTNYTVDAASGRITFVNVGGFTQPFKLSYGYTDPASVSIFTAGQKKFALDYEFINRRQDNEPGSLELYTVIFDPAKNLDFQSADLQVMELVGSCLADTTRDSDDTELGQFGRRIL